MIKKHQSIILCALLALLLAAGFALPLAGCTAQDALEFLTAIYE